jgi:hypothetical protein
MTSAALTQRIHSTLATADKIIAVAHITLRYGNAATLAAEKFLSEVRTRIN